MDLVVAQGGKWQYKYGETCKEYHPLEFRMTPKAPCSMQESLECSLCSKEIEKSDENDDSMQES